MGILIDFNPRSTTGKYAAIQPIKNLLGRIKGYEFTVYGPPSKGFGVIVEQGIIKNEKSLKKHLWKRHGILYLRERTFFNFLDWYEKITGRELLPPEQEYVENHLKTGGANFNKKSSFESLFNV